MAPDSFRLPTLRVLCLAKCDMPEIVWHLPALSSLELDDVVFSANMNERLSVLVRLQSLALSFRRKNKQQCFIISCPELLSLELRSSSMTTTSSLTSNIVVMAPNLRSFSSVGIFPVMCGVSKLENVNIKLRGCFKHKRLGNAKILTLDLDTVEALIAVSDFLARFPSPFYNLNFLKLPKGYQQSSLSGALKDYLLGGSPEASIVTGLTQYHNNPESDLVSLPGWNALLREPVARAGNAQASSSRETSGFRLWRGHEVKSVYVSLLERITKEYPDTLKHITSKVDVIQTMMLNVFCTTVNSYMNTAVADGTAAMITEYRALFSDLQRWGFDICWLFRRLNYVEELRNSKPLINELRAIFSGVHDMQTLLPEKMTEIHKRLLEPWMLAFLFTLLATTYFLVLSYLMVTLKMILQIV